MRVQAPPPPQVENLMDLLDLGGDDEQPAAQATTAASTGEPAAACAATASPVTRKMIVGC